MAEPEKSKTGSLTRTAARASCATFGVALACVAVVSLAPSLQILAPVVLLAPVLGLFLGVTALIGAGKAFRSDILTAFAGVAVNGVWMLVIFFDLSRPCPRCTLPKAACIANLKQLEGAKATWAALPLSRRDTPTIAQRFSVGLDVRQDKSRSDD